MKFVTSLLLCLGLFTIAAAEFQADRTIKWPRRPSSDLQGAVPLPNGRIVVFGAHDNEASYSLIDPDQGHLFTRAVPERLLDWAVKGDGTVFLVARDKISRFDPAGVRLWTIDPGQYIIDIAIDPTVGVLVLTQANTQHELNLYSLDDSGQLHSRFSISSEAFRGKIVSADEVYAIHTTGLIEYDGTLTLARHNGTGQMLGSHSWQNYTDADHGYYGRSDIREFHEPIAGYLPFLFVTESVTEAGHQGYARWTLFPRDALGNNVPLVPYALIRRVTYVVETDDAYYEVSEPQQFMAQVSKRLYDGTIVWSRDIEVRDISGAALHNGDLFWWGALDNNGERLPYLEKVDPDSGKPVNSLSGVSGRFVSAGDHFWLVEQEPSSVPNASLVARRFTPVPTATRDYYITNVGQSLSVGASEGVLANDDMAEGAQAALVAQPQHGTVSLNADGGFTYTPEGGFQGFDNIEYYFTKGSYTSNVTVFAIAVGTFAYKHTLLPKTVIGGNNVTGMVTLSQPAGAGGFTVNLSSTSSVISVPATVVVPAGLSKATYVAQTNGVDSQIDRAVIATGGYVPLHAVLRVQPAALAGIAVGPANQIYGGMTAIGTLFLNGKTGPSGMNVQVTDDSSVVMTPGSVQIPANTQFFNFDIGTAPVAQDTVRTVKATHVNVFFATIGIQPARLDSLSIAPSLVNGGDTATATITMKGRVAANQTFVIDRTSGLEAPASVTMPAGLGLVSFPVTAKPTWEPYVGTVHTSDYAGERSAQLSVRGTTLQALTLSPASVVGGKSSVGTIALTGKAPDAATISLESNSSVVQVPSSVTVLQGSSNATFTVTTSSVTATYTRQVLATLGSAKKAASITITPSALQSLTVSPTTVAGGSNTTGTVSFLSPVSSPQEVAISENSSALQAPPSVTVATGQKTASFPIATSATASTFTRQVTATHQGVSRTANVTVVPATLLSITVSPSTVEGGKPSTGTVTFNGKVAQAVFVSLASNSSAVQVPANVFVQAGQKSVTFQVTTSKVTETSTRQVAANYNGVVKTASITLQP